MPETTTLEDYQCLFRQLPGSLLLLAPDEQATIIDSSGYPAALLHSPAGLPGQSLFAALAVDTSTRELLRDSLTQVRRQQQPHTTPLLPAPAAGPAPRAWQVTHSPILNAQGELRFILHQLREAPEPVSTASTASPSLAQQLLDDLPAMVWTTRPDGSADYQNPQWLRFTGRTLAEALEWNWLDDIHPDDRAPITAQWNQALRTGIDYQVEYRLRHHSGQYRWLLVRARPRRNAAGDITAWLGIGTDIHDQKEVQQQLAARDQELLQILRQVPAYIATMRGPEHVYTFLNERAQVLLGETARLGVPATVARPEFHVNGYLHLINEIYRTGQPFPLVEMPMPQAPAADGSVATLYFDGVLQPLTDEQGQPQGILAFGIDVTERVQAKQHTAELMAEVRHQDIQFRTLVESIPLFVYITDPTGQMLYMNPQRLAYTGQSLPVGLGRWAEIIHPDDRARMEAVFAEGRARRQPWSGEYRLRRHDGEYRWFLTRAVPLLAADGAVEQWYGSSVDIDHQRRLQEQLEAKDQLWQRIMEHMPAGVATLEGPEFRFTFVSASSNRWTKGRAQAGLTVAEALPEVVGQGFLTVLDQVYQTGQPFVLLEQPVELLNPDTGGYEISYVNASYQLLPPLPGSHPGSRGILNFVADVTEQVLARRRADELKAEVHRRDKELRLLTESSPAVVFSVDPTDHFLYLSPQWYAYTGLPADADLRATWLGTLHPDDRARVQQARRSAFATAQPWRYEYRLRRHDGQYRWFLSQGNPDFGPDGQPLRWYGFSVDINDQKELQQQLERSEEQFRFLAESIPQVVWTAAPDGQVDYLNQRWTELTGMPVEQALRYGWSELIPPDEVERVVGNYLAGISSGSNYEQESRLLSTLEGHYRWYLHRGTPMRDAEGRVVKWFGTSTDIDDFKRAQQQLEKQNAQLARTNDDLDNFVYTASHDLRQPINNMAGIFEELKRTATFHDPEAGQLLAMFESALQQIYITMRDLSTVVQVQRQVEALPALPVKLLPLAQEVVASVQQEISRTAATIELDFSTLPTLTFVPHNLRSVLYNLLSNAIKYAAPERPPHIRIATTLHDGVPVLSISDNGLGIDLGRHGPELFRMFRRFHDHIEGSGIGLYLVNRIVQQAGGRIEVESTVNQGTTFRLFMPLLSPGSSLPAAASPGPKLSPPVA
jgi:PAS domain S-box-containing protein